MRLDVAAEQDARYRALLALIDLPTVGEALPGLVTEFARRLAPVLPFDECLVLRGLDEEGADAVAWHRPADAAAGAPGEVERISLFGIDSEACHVSGAIVLDDISSAPSPAGVVELLRRRGHRSACLLPFARQSASAGTMCLAASRPCAFAGTDLAFLERAATLLAIAVESHDNRLRLQGRQRELEAERDHWRSLLQVNNALVGTLDLEALRAAISCTMSRIIAHELLSLMLLDAEGQRIALFSLDPRVPPAMRDAMALIKMEDWPFVDPASLRTPHVFEPQEMAYLPAPIRDDATFRSMTRFCLLPLVTPRRTIGSIVLSTRASDAFPPEEVDRGAQAAGQVAIALENAMAFQEIAALRDRLAEENLYLEEEIRGWNEFEDIVGSSKALQRVLAQVRSVADTETTVLLLGETGTGKELFARAIHDLSARKSRTLVAVNCAASPAGLLESEWFGYEKGAFTGALARKVGRFELADKGTLFLDEVGDIPLDLQAKLLRVLQEREVERVGATRPVRVDFRLVAATNADLQATVEASSLDAALLARPELQALNARRTSALAAADAAAADRRPVLVAIGQAGYTHDGYLLNQWNASAAIALRVPVLDGGKSAAKSAEYRASARALELSTEVARRQVAAELTATAAAERAARQRLAAAERAVAASTEALRLERLRHGQGLATTRELLQAMTDDTTAQAAQAAARASFTYALAESASSGGVDLLTLFAKESR